MAKKNIKILDYKMVAGDVTYIKQRFTGMTLAQFKRNLIIQFGSPLKIRKVKI